MPTPCFRFVARRGAGLLAPLLTILFGSLFGLACADQSDWVVFRGANGAGATRNSIYPPLGQRWKLRLQFKGDRAESFNPPVVKDDVIYFGSSDGNFYALDSESGYMKWIFQTKNEVNSVPYVDDQAVYFGSNDGNVYAVNLEDGKQRWAYQTGNTVQSLILRYQDTVIFTSDTGWTFFVDLDGKLQHRIPNYVWLHHTFQVYDGIVYWAPLGRGFGAYDIEKRRFLWDVDVTIDAPVWYSFAAIDEERVYYASSFWTNRGPLLTYYALDRRNGASIWKKESEFEWGRRMTPNADNAFRRHVKLLDYMAPALWKDVAIYTSGDTIVRAFDRESGELTWKREFEYGTSSAPTVAGDRVYFGLYGDEPGPTGVVADPPKLICLSAKNGATLWEMELEGALLSAPVVSGKRMFFGTSQNMFYVLEEIF